MIVDKHKILLYFFCELLQRRLLIRSLVGLILVHLLSKYFSKNLPNARDYKSKFFHRLIFSHDLNLLYRH